MPIKSQNSILKLLLLMGIALRIFYFFLNRSLWIDEVYLGASIVEKAMDELLTKPLLYFQKAPLGFLFFEKVFVLMLPASELSLRLFPLLCGIGSLVLFLPVAKHFLNQNLVWLAVALFAFAPPLIYHSAEAKQYSTELFASVAMLFFYGRYATQATLKRFILLSLAGVIIIWFSYPVIFILAGIGLSLLVEALLANDKRSLWKYLSLTFLWVTSFMVNYFLFTYKHAQSEWTVYWFEAFGHFAPLIPGSIKEITWFPLNFYRMLDYPLGLWWNLGKGGNDNLNLIMNMAFIPALLLLVGAVRYWKQRKIAIVLFMPVVLVLVASGLKLYPLTERFWVFLAPVFILLIVHGCAFINYKYLKRYRLILPFLLFAGPVTGTLRMIFQPDSFIYKKASSQREALDYIKQHLQPDDRVYVYWNALAGYKLYSQLYAYNFSAVHGKDLRWDSNNFAKYLDKFKTDVSNAAGGKRIWLVLNHTFQSDIGETIDSPAWYFKGNNKPTERVVEWFQKKYGKPVHVYKKFDVHVYCFAIEE